jgi:hypothetical protein
LTLTEDVSTLKYPKMKAVAEAEDGITTEEVLVVVLVEAEALADLEVATETKEVLLQEVLVVSDQEKKVVLEVMLQNVKVVFHPIDLPEKVDLEAMLQEENLVLLKEKIEHQDVLKELQTDLLVVRLTKLKQEDQEEANTLI